MLSFYSASMNINGSTLTFHTWRNKHDIKFFTLFSQKKSAMKIGSKKSFFPLLFLGTIFYYFLCYCESAQTQEHLVWRSYSIHMGKYSKHYWTQTWATCSSWPFQPKQFHDFEIDKHRLLRFLGGEQWTRQTFVRCIQVSVSLLYLKCPTLSLWHTVLISTPGNPRQIIAGTVNETSLFFSSMKD